MLEPNLPIQKAPDEAPRVSIMPTIYDQENPGTYIRRAPEVSLKDDGAEVLEFPDIYDETNLALLDQYKLDWQRLKERYGNLSNARKRLTKVGGATLAATLALAITAPGETVAQGFQVRAHQIADIFK